jgi:hypothetical protein
MIQMPEWLDKAKIQITLDARPIIAAGDHPLQRVISECETLENGNIFEIITPFPPLPMVEKMGALGYRTFTETTDLGLYHTYFSRG